jgi:hypothetical protein
MAELVPCLAVASFLTSELAGCIIVTTGLSRPVQIHVYPYIYMYWTSALMSARDEVPTLRNATLIEEKILFTVTQERAPSSLRIGLPDDSTFRIQRLAAEMLCFWAWMRLWRGTRDRCVLAQPASQSSIARGLDWRLGEPPASGHKSRCPVEQRLP